MKWACEFTENAQQDFSSLPKAIQKRVVRVVTQMSSDPFQGNVKALQGEEWKGVFRRRLGDYRLLFTVNHDEQKVVIHQITLRSGKDLPVADERLIIWVRCAEPMTAGTFCPGSGNSFQP